VSRSPELIGKSQDSLREAFGKTLVSLADDYPSVIVLDADVAGGTGVHHFRKSFPDRFIQCGIAEQNMVSVAAGMAATGLIPVVTTFSVFLLRAYEQVRLSVAYAQMNVKLVGSHCGLDVGPDGGSAQCLEDIAAFRALPNLSVIVPASPLEISQATKFILEYDGPVYMRSGRSPVNECLNDSYQFEFGKGKYLFRGSDLTIISCGVSTGRACEVVLLLRKLNIEAELINMSTIKPIDKEIIIESATKTSKVVTVEDHNIIGGLGSAVAEVLAEHRIAKLKRIGIKDTFGESGEPDQLAFKYGIDSASIENTILDWLRE
jgi:transketolase